MEELSARASIVYIDTNKMSDSKINATETPHSICCQLFTIKKLDEFLW
jgi:hypothetical protein